ncbi:MAG: GDP-mannose 4,6-dehydratase [bacterium]|nr:GDP-mannose 4,6-dehydratase [bacterium]
MQRLLVTGGAGFIGSHLVERLLDRGDEVVCLDDFNDYYDPAIKRENIRAAAAHQRFLLIEGDIRDAALLEAVARDGRFDAVVHLAARAGVRASIREPVLYEDVNCRGTLNLLEMCRRHGIGRFVFGSSSSVYGRASRVPFSEEDPAVHPISPYAATKRAGELLCFVYHHLYGMRVTCLRFFTVYGPRQRPEMAVAGFTRRVIGGEPIDVYGDGSSRRDYTHVDDIVDGATRAIDTPFPYEVFNLGESRTVALGELIALIEKAAGRKARINRLPEQPGDVPVTYADVRRAGEMLGYRPRVPIEDGIERYVSWWRGRSR